MKLINLFTAAILSSVLLTACSSEKPRSGEYYWDNPKKAQETYEKCAEESKKGYKPEGVFAENCKTVLPIYRQQQRRAIRDAISGN